MPVLGDCSTGSQSHLAPPMHWKNTQVNWAPKYTAGYRAHRETGESQVNTGVISRGELCCRVLAITPRLFIGCIFSSIPHISVCQHLHVCLVSEIPLWVPCDPSKALFCCGLFPLVQLKVTLQATAEFSSCHLSAFLYAEQPHLTHGGQRRGLWLICSSENGGRVPQIPWRVHLSSSNTLELRFPIYL